jgi:hypothetical protein
MLDLEPMHDMLDFESKYLNEHFLPNVYYGLGPGGVGSTMQESQMWLVESPLRRLAKTDDLNEQEKLRQEVVEGEQIVNCDHQWKANFYPSELYAAVGWMLVQCQQCKCAHFEMYSHD